MQNEFKHSGDLGDIIMSLPTIKELGGGVLYLDPLGGENEKLVSWGDGKFTCTKLNESLIKAITPLLEAQDYIKEVRLLSPSNKVKYNLDRFRRHLKYNNLMRSHLEAFSIGGKVKKWQTTPWITVEPKALPEGKGAIISRSCRYHSNYGFWENLGDDIIDTAMFIGHEKEFEYFIYTFPMYKGRLERLETSNILDLAGYIADCELFLGNQGFPLTIAEALKKQVVNEVYRIYPAAIFDRPGVRYV